MAYVPPGAEPPPQTPGQFPAYQGPAPAAAPPPGPAPATPPAQPVQPAAAKKKGRGCLGCLTGCLVPILVVVAVIAGGFYFLAGRASATVSVPAQLVVIHDTVNLTHSGTATAVKSGAVVHEGDTVDTGTDPAGTARASLQFEDGSLTRIAPGSRVTLTKAEFDKSGRLAGVGIDQAAGRSLSTVSKLLGGAKFTVKGHNASAEVRGTQFEVIVNADGSVVLKVFSGTVHMVGDRDVAVGAGQQVTVGPDNKVGNPTPLVNDPNDPFQPWINSEAAAGAAGGVPGSAQTSGAALAQGQTSNEPDYDGGGGDVIGALTYPGSAFRLTITDPSGRRFESNASVAAPQGGRLVVVVIPGGVVGRYKVQVTAEQTNGGKAENYSVTMITKYVCQAGATDTSGVVRNVMSASAAQAALAQAGIGNASINFSGTSVGGAYITGTGSYAGTSVSGGAVLYAANGSLGAIVTNVTVNGINLTQQVTNYLAGATGGRNLEGMDVNYYLDRVYTCGAGGDTFLVLEGHH